MNPTTNATAAGAKSTLKVFLPIAVLIAVIFGVTFFSQYVPQDETNKEKGPNSNPPLRFFSSTRAWNPPSFAPPTREQPTDFRGLPLLAPSAAPSDPDFPFRFNLQDRAFPGFYEVKDDTAGIKHAASFWFENPHSSSVTLHLKGVSCSSCSGGRVASVPPDVVRQLLQMSRVSALPQGFVSGLPLGMVGPAANLDEHRLNWQYHLFQNTPDATYKVPAAGDNPDGWRPQWGILQLHFSVGAVGPKPLQALFEATVDGTDIVERNEFRILSNGTNPFDLTREHIDLGEMSEKSEPRKYEVIAYSSTRGSSRTGPGEMGDLAPPVASVRMPLAQGGDPGEFVQISSPERVPDAELGRVAEMVAEQTKRQKLVRVEGAYRYTVTVNPRVGEKSIDIGVLEREIWFSLPGAAERKLLVKGLVSGVVWLDNNQNDIALENTPYSAGFTRTFKLITARPDLEVRLLRGETKPDHLVVNLEKDPSPASADRGYYRLTVRVPSSKESNRVRPGSWSGEVVLEVKGATVQRVRIPIKGRIALN